jgi:hypothetical protein
MEKKQKNTLEDCLLKKGIVGRTFRTKDNIEYSVLNRPFGFAYCQGHTYFLVQIRYKNDRDGDMTLLEHLSDEEVI